MHMADKEYRKLTAHVGGTVEVRLRIVEFGTGQDANRRRGCSRGKERMWSLTERWKLAYEVLARVRMNLALSI